MFIVQAAATQVAARQHTKQHLSAAEEDAACWPMAYMPSIPPSLALRISRSVCFGVSELTITLADAAGPRIRVEMHLWCQCSGLIYMYSPIELARLQIALSCQGETVYLHTLEAVSDVCIFAVTRSVLSTLLAQLALSSNSEADQQQVPKEADLAVLIRIGLADNNFSITR